MGNVADGFARLDDETELLRQRHASGLPHDDPALQFAARARAGARPAGTPDAHVTLCDGPGWAVSRRLPKTRGRSPHWILTWDGGRVELEFRALPGFASVQPAYEALTRGEEATFHFARKGPAKGRGLPGVAAGGGAAAGDTPRLELRPPARHEPLAPQAIHGTTRLVLDGAQVEIPYFQVGLVLLADLYMLTAS